MTRVARKPHGLSGRFEILKQYIVNAENGRWVAGAGLNEAKEALVFGTSAVQLTRVSLPRLEQPKPLAIVTNNTVRTASGLLLKDHLHRLDGGDNLSISGQIGIAE